MKPIVRSLSRAGYRSAIKPALFRQAPDMVHARLVRMAKKVQTVPFVRSLPGLWAYRSSRLNVSTLGHIFANPVGLSAGFDKAVEMPMVMKRVGFGWMTGGSVTWGAYEGNERPWFHRLPKSKSLVVNAGLPSEGTPVVAKRVAAYSPALFSDFPLSVSVAKTNSKECASDEAAIEDYCSSLGSFDKLLQVRLLELNISCPNTFGGEPFTTPHRLDKLLTAIDALTLHKPLLVKMPIGLPMKQFDDLLKVIVSHHVAGVTIGNLLKDRARAKLKDELTDSVKGNLSGAPNRHISTELVKRAYEQYGDRLIIVGVGGIMSAEDAYEKIRAGATLVALITGMIYEGPQLVGEITKGLVRLLERDGLTNITDAIGVNTERGKRI